MDLHAKLRELGLTLPPAQPPGAVYVPVRQVGELLYVSGHVPMSEDGKVLVTGLLPTDVSIEEAQKGAERCALNGLAAVDKYLNGDWSRFVQFVRLGVFVQSAVGFDKQHIVANGASQLLEGIFGERGGHARTAIGTNALPLNAAVEVEMILQVR